MQWAHGIEDTYGFDVDGYYYLFNSPIVRTQLQQNFMGKNFDHKIILERVVKRRSKRILKRTL